MFRIFIERILVIALVVAAVPSLATEVQTPDGVVSVHVPNAFTQLTEAEVKLKFGRTPVYPLASFGSRSRGSTISVSWGNAGTKRLSQARLPELLAFMTSALEKGLQGIRWHEKRIIEVRGRQWIFLDYTAPALDMPIRTRMYMTDLKGNMVTVGMSSIASEETDAKPSFENAAQSLSVW